MCILCVFQGGPRQESYRYAVTPGTEKKKSKKKKGKENLENLKQELEMDEHKIPIEELYERLGTDPNTVCHTSWLSSPCHSCACGLVHAQLGQFILTCWVDESLNVNGQ